MLTISVKTFEKPHYLLNREHIRHRSADGILHHASQKNSLF